MTDLPAPADDHQEAVPGLAERLALVDAQPLEERAAAYAGLHDDLRAVLEDQPRHDALPAAGPVPGRR
ncbi:hypothetical protein [Frigoribacterium salinisoli]